MNATILVGDCRERMAEMPEKSVQCVVTSPPYWGLRDYGTVGQLGLEPTPEAYVAKMVEVFREVRRVLRDDGTLWLNLGDSYWGGKGENGSSKARATADERGYVQSGGTVQMSKRPQDGRHSQIKPKDLVGIPWRVAFALQADGWYLRSDIIWSKPNPMPESVTDRPTKSHEYVFLLTKSARYFFDQEAVREEHSAAFRSSGANALRGQAEIRPRGNLASVDEQSYNPSGRNIRSVWTIATQPFPDAHFATYPEELVERCIKAGSRQDDTVLDPFTGSGTTGVVALNLGRSFVGVELNPTYVAMAERRIANVAPLLAEVTTHNAPETHQDAPQTTFPDFP